MFLCVYKLVKILFFLKCTYLKFSFCVLSIRNTHNLIFSKLRKTLQMEAKFLLVEVVLYRVALSKHADNSNIQLTLKCQRVRTATTIAVVVLPLPLEQLKTNAEWESSAKELFMPSSSLSKSCRWLNIQILPQYVFIYADLYWYHMKKMKKILNITHKQFWQIEIWFYDY